MEGIGLTIIIYLIGLFILYIIIETAVRRGINSSIIGLYLENKYGIQDTREKKNSFLDDDLNKD
ncbi:hypothetical protein SAMN05421743_106211 [Thalassobacillus cyri]|uniref:Uncharacterized protein n=1 Tax=Thalassobacillus cyri TaxID=571932 RepID=A0A1H4CVL6_9BACI|nr:hypothetical protein [Thalassobacillus cyri]SEA64359.1 hypothetical protein SAMN05421743_106211 [Thalassobacillus cyri]